MKKVNTYGLILSAFLLLFSFAAKAQITVDCANCPVDFMATVVDGVVVDEIVVPEQAVDDLGVMPLQSVCLDITHSWLGDLFIVLESPGGKEYFLMGDEDNNTGGCGSSEANANICFQLGSTDPLSNGSSYDFYCDPTDPINCLSGDWNVGCGNTMISDLTPTAMEAPNCDLNDFNVAGDPVSGTWRVSLGCVCGAGEDAVLNDWSLNFQVPSLQPCGGPPTTEAFMAHQPCEDDQLKFSAENGVEYEWTGPNNYNNTTAEIAIPDFSDAVAGIYNCKITTTANCYDMHEIEVKNICQKESMSIYLGSTQQICTEEILAAGFVNEDTNNGYLDLLVNDNCVYITNVSPGVDSVYVLEKVGDDEIYRRYIVEAMQVSSTNESFPAGWTLSPNPTLGQLLLKTAAEQPTAITVVDMQGATKQVVAPESGSTLLDLSDLANGVYIVRVKTEQGMFYERVALMK